MTETFDLERFVKAQDPVMDQVQRELRAGHKQTHWMWFIFPQLRGLGRSDTARFYGIGSREEAQAYLRHPVLGPRLVACTELVNGVSGRTVHDIFGSPDDMKFHSCMSLFAFLPGAAPAFTTALAKYFAGKRDPKTTEALDQ